jgi:hypothetical protein
MQKYRDTSEKRHDFLSRFKTLCKVYGLTYSEAVFHPYRFRDNVELEFILSGYRLALLDFNEGYADTYIHLLTTFADNNKEIGEDDKTNLDVVMKHFHKEFPYHAKYAPLELDYDVEYKMWQEYYEANNETPRPFYMEQDMDILSIEEIGELAFEYETYINTLKRGLSNETKGLDGFKGLKIKPHIFKSKEEAYKAYREFIGYTPDYINDYKEMKELGFHFPETSTNGLLDDTKLDRIKATIKEIETPRKRSSSRYIKFNDDKAINRNDYNKLVSEKRKYEISFNVQLPITHPDRDVEVELKKSIKSKLLDDYSLWLDGYINLT